MIQTYTRQINHPDFTQINILFMERLPPKDFIGLKYVPSQISRVFRLEPDIAILYRFVLQNEKTKYYPTPSGNRTQAPWLQFQHAPFWATEACAT